MSPYPPWRRPDEPLPVSRTEVVDYLEDTVKAAEAVLRIQRKIANRTNRKTQ